MLTSDSIGRRGAQIRFRNNPKSSILARVSRPTLGCTTGNVQVELLRLSLAPSRVHDASCTNAAGIQVPCLQMQSQSGASSRCGKTIASLASTCRKVMQTTTKELQVSDMRIWR